VDSAGNLYIADSYNNRIHKVTPAGVITTVVGNGSGGIIDESVPAASAHLSPSAVAVDSAGNLFIADYEGRCIRKVFR
jgi:sugar lactone lactonase YvrE